MRQLIVLIFAFLTFSCNNNPANKTSENVMKVAKKKYVLVEIPADFVHCGIIKNLIGFKFMKLDNNNTHLILFVPCPELYGNNFFSKDGIYDVQISATGNKYKDFAISNIYQNEKLPTFYIDEIKKSNDSP